MWLLQISITCLVFARLPHYIGSSSPDDHLPRFSQREKLPIRRSVQHPSGQSPASSSTSTQPRQLPEWDLISPSYRHPHGLELHSLTSHFHGIEHPPPMHSAVATSSVPAETSLRSRSRSPPGKPPPYSSLFGIKIDDLRFRRFFPVNNSSRELVIRLYDFRQGTPIFVKDNSGRISEPLTGVHFILSGVNGDALALVEKRQIFKTTLLGLYMPPGPRGLRAKINIFTHHVSSIEPEEAKDTPLGKTSFNNYLTIRTVDVPVEPFFPAGSTSYSLPSSYKLFGIKIEEFPFYRFFPVRNPSWELGIQSHTFSADAGLYSRTEKQKLDSEKLTGEHIILSDMNGNAVALLKKSPTGQSILRGLYIPNPSRPGGNRVTFNIFTGSVRKMTGHEMYTAPLANKKDIRNHYDVRHVDVGFAPRRNAS